MVAAAASLATAVASTAGAIGGMTKSGGASASGATSNAPWEPQQPYLKGGFADAKSMYQSALNQPIPNQFVAQQNEAQKVADQGMVNTGLLGASNAAQWQQNGATMAGYQVPQASFAAGLAMNGIGPQSDATGLMAQYAKTGQMAGASQVDPRLASSITQAGISGLGSLGSGAQVAQQAGQMALNPNGTMNAAMAGASSLSSNPGLDAAIDAANRDTNRDLTENTLPQMRLSAMGSGNANSSREGAMEAIATRGAADRMSDTAAAMRLGAYTQGANLGSTGYNAGLNTAVSAGNSLTSNGTSAGSLLNTQQGLQQSQGQFDTSSRLGAANNTASQDLAYQGTNFNAQLAGNSQFGQSIQNGFGNQVNGLNSAITGLNAAYTGGSNDQAGDQARINEGLANYNAQTTAQQNILDRYWKVVGGGFGSSSTTSSTNQPNNGGLGGALAGAVGGAAAGYGAYKNLTGNTDPFGFRTPADNAAQAADPWRNGTNWNDSMQSQADAYNRQYGMGG